MDGRETFNLDTIGIADATGCPLANVERYWPALQAACVEYGMTTRARVIAVIATVGTEVASFEPINEPGTIAYFTAHYENRKDLGNSEPGDGARYHGRGFIHISGRGNYRSYGQQLGVPLESDPIRALDPSVAARILGVYFQRHNIATKADQGDWQGIREAVSGGLNGWDRFESLVTRLEQAAAREADTLVEGAIGPGIVELKRMLTAWGRTHQLPQPIADTPMFGAATTAAVKAFQQVQKLQPTGKVTQPTWTALEKATVVRDA